MIPYRVNVISPYLKDKTRLTALSSGVQFGYNMIHDEHMMERLNAFVGNLSNQDVYDTYRHLRNREMPDLTRERVLGNEHISSDILLNDTFRQHNEICERYRKKLTSLHDIRKLNDGATRYHIACSRGYERHLVDFISRMDTEMLDRKSIRPLLRGSAPL